MGQSDPKRYLADGLRRVLGCGFVDFLGIYEFLGYEEIAKLSMQTLMACFGRVIDKDDDAAGPMREAVVATLSPDDFARIILDMMNLPKDDTMKIDEMTLQIFEAAMNKNSDVCAPLCKAALDGRGNVGCFLNDGQIEEMVECMNQRKLLDLIQTKEREHLFEENKPQQSSESSGGNSGKSAHSDSGLLKKGWSKSGESTKEAPGNA